MPTPRHFNQCPGFPSNLPVAQIPTISFKKLLENSKSESEELFEAATQHGFFVLDLRGSTDGDALLKDAESIFDITETTLSLAKSELNQYAYNPPKSLFGYKCAGKLRTDDGKLDVMDMYMIGQDDMLGNCPPSVHPELLRSQHNRFRDFFYHARVVIEVILFHFDKQLDLTPGTLASLCPLDQQSDTSFRLLRSPPQNVTPEDRCITLGGHTDIGLITLLFHVAGGLQILPAGSKNIDANWRYIRPECSCALINIGDTMVEWTGGLVRSSLHRVVTAPGKQAQVPRLSLAYLIRPEYKASMRRLQGGTVIPLLAEGENDDTRSVSDWAAWRARQIMNGELKPQTRGGTQRNTAN